MKILTASQMQRIDRLTTERYGVPSLTLMENAGRGVVEFLEEHFAPLEQQRIAILCGRGNNGGDGLVVARLLRDQGLKPRVLLFADPQESARGRGRQPRAAGDFRECRRSWKRRKFGATPRPSLQGTTLVVDALLGTGLTKPLGGFAAGSRSRNQRGIGPQRGWWRLICLPGISADSAELIGEYVRADFSVTFTAPKIAHVFPPACETCRALGAQADRNTAGGARKRFGTLSESWPAARTSRWLTRPRQARRSQGKFWPCPDSGRVRWERQGQRRWLPRQRCALGRAW